MQFRSITFAKLNKSFFRDPNQWSQLLLLTALVVVYLYNFRVLPLDKSPLPSFFLQNLISFLNMGLAGFVLCAVSGRFIFPAVSLEGSAFWIIRSSPISLKNILWSKFWTGLIPLLILAEALILLSNWLLKVTLLMAILAPLSLFFITFGIAGLGVGVGAVYPRFKVENAAQIASSFGGVLFMILSMFFIAAIVILEAWPVYTLFIAGFRNQAITFWQWVQVAICFLAAAILISGAIFIPMRLGIKNISEMDI